MNILDIIKADYAKFPAAQTYAIYREDVYFKDPVYEFRGLQKYQKMVGFITQWFQNLTLELHDISRSQQVIRTEWTMAWDAPLPWKRRVAVKGWSELTLDESDRIASHVDYWYCTKWDLIQQHFPWSKPVV